MATETRLEVREWIHGRAILGLEALGARFDDSRRSRTILALVHAAVAAAVVIQVTFGGGREMSRIDEPTHADFA